MLQCRRHQSPFHLGSSLTCYHLLSDDIQNSRNDQVCLLLSYKILELLKGQGLQYQLLILRWSIYQRLILINSLSIRFSRFINLCHHGQILIKECYLNHFQMRLHALQFNSNGSYYTEQPHQHNFPIIIHSMLQTLEFFLADIHFLTIACKPQRQQQILLHHHLHLFVIQYPMYQYVRLPKQFDQGILILKFQTLNCLMQNFQQSCSIKLNEPQFFDFSVAFVQTSMHLKLLQQRMGFSQVIRLCYTPCSQCELNKYSKMRQILLKQPQHQTWRLLMALLL